MEISEQCTEAAEMYAKLDNFHFYKKLKKITHTVTKSNVSKDFKIDQIHKTSAKK